MLPVLYNSDGFDDIPIRERQKAAWEARQKAMRHWQFWCAIAFMPLATLLGSLAGREVLPNDRDGAVGAFCGFVLGLAGYTLALYRIGMPYYCEILSKHSEKCAKRGD